MAKRIEDGIDLHEKLVIIQFHHIDRNWAFDATQNKARYWCLCGEEIENFALGMARHLATEILRLLDDLGHTEEATLTKENHQS